MRRLIVGIILVLFGQSWLGASGPTATHEDKKITPSNPASGLVSVYVSHSGKDAAGQAFATGLREAIRTASAYQLAPEEDAADVVVVIVSVSPDSRDRIASAVALSYVANNEWRSLLGSAARFVGRDVAGRMGHEALAELDQVVAAYGAGIKPL